LTKGLILQQAGSANLEGHLVEGKALRVDLIKSSINVDISLTADTTEEELSLTEVSVIVTTSIKEGSRKLLNARVTLLGIKVGTWRIDIATLLVAALHLAVVGAVLTNAVLVAVAAPVAGLASGHAQVMSIRLGSKDDGLSHFVDSPLDGDLLVELLEVLLSRLSHEDVLGGHERNIEGRDGVSDLDRLSLDINAGLVVLSKLEGSKLLLTILAGLTVTLDVLLDVIKLILEGVTGLAVDLSIVDPEEGVDISDVGTDGRIVVVSKAACTDGSGSGDIDVGRELELVEDRAREASLNVEDEVLEHLPGSHGIEGLLHLGGIEVAATREAHGTLRTVIIEEDKDVIVRTRLEGLATADTLHVLTSKNLEESLTVDIAASVILRNTVVHIRTVRLVDDSTLLGVLSIVGDIILHHNNDTLIRDTHLVDNLIGMADISLMTIVVITIRTSSKNNPGVLLDILLRKVGKRVGTNGNSQSKDSNPIIHLCI